MQGSGADDQRKNSAIEGSPTMTIEFLRARLLSERSVSRTAKQRADQLAKRVAELEEQLKIVSIGRKKAGKAAAEVLAILESHGVNDFSEALDSSSDQEGVMCESKESNTYVKEDEHSMTSKSRSEAEDGLSGSELGASPASGRSLSWKSCSNRSDSSGRKNFAQARRRHSSVISTGGSSPKHRLGKSCRQIKRRETRAAAEDARDASLILAEENEVATGLGNISNHIEYRPEIFNGCSKNEENSVFPEIQRKDNDAGLNANGGDRDGEMERALEQQAQLIGRYAAEENAQREWEEKFRENNNYALDSCEPGNQSDITEEKNEPQTNEDTEPVDTDPSYYEGIKRKTNKVHSIKEATTSDSHVRTDPTAHDRSNELHAGMNFTGQHSNGMEASECEMGIREFVFPAQEYPVSKMKGKHSDDSTLSDSKFQPVPHGSPENGSVVKSSIWGDVDFSGGELSGRQNQLHGMPHQRANSLGGVLEALQRAKVSLQHELKSPGPSQGIMTTVPDTRVRSIKAGDALDIPMGSAGLFRLPTESRTYTSSLSNISTPYSDFGSTRHSPDISFDTIPRYQYPTNPYIEAGSRISAGQTYSDPYYLGMGMPAAGRYSNPQMDLSMAVVPTNARHPTHYSDTRTGMPSGDRYSLYDDQFRTGMYR